MAGLGTALAYVAAGAAQGWGQGQLENIKTTRAEKMRQLELDRAERIEGQRQAFQREQGALDRASQKELTNAQLGVQERLGKLQAETTTAVTKLNIGSQEKMTQAQIDARMKEIGATTASAERIAKWDRDSRKDLVQMQLDAAAALDGEFVLQEDGTQVYMVGGKPVEMPTDPATGKPMNPAAASTDTEDVKTMKYLVTVGGMTQEAAQELVLGAKNQTEEALHLTLFDSAVKAAANLSVVGEDELQDIYDLTGGMAKKMKARAAAAGTPAADATTASPDSPAPASSATQPDALTTAQKQAVIAEAKRAILPKGQGGGGKSRAAVREALINAGVPAAEIAEAGL